MVLIYYFIYVLYIRFNPDKYKNKRGKKRNPTIAKRLGRLKMEIEFQIERIKNENNKQPLEIIKLFYDDFD